MVEESKVPASQESLDSLPDTVPNPAKLDEFICPISRAQMRDPVVAGDGHTYERNYITRIIEEGGRSPLTGEPFAHKWLTVNHNLRKVMDDNGCQLKRNVDTVVQVGAVEQDAQAQEGDEEEMPMPIDHRANRLDGAIHQALVFMEAEMRRLRLFVTDDGALGNSIDEAGGVQMRSAVEQEVVFSTDGEDEQPSSGGEDEPSDESGGDLEVQQEEIPALGVGEIAPAMNGECPLCVPGSGKPVGHVGAHRRRPMTPE